MNIEILLNRLLQCGFAVELGTWLPKGISTGLLYQTERFHQASSFDSARQEGLPSAHTYVSIHYYDHLKVLIQETFNHRFMLVPGIHNGLHPERQHLGK